MQSTHDALYVGEITEPAPCNPLSQHGGSRAYRIVRLNVTPITGET